MEAWEIVGSRYLLKRPWMRLREDQVRLPSGDVLDEFHVIEYPDWACICCLTDEGQMILIEQYRHGVGRSCLELPAGEIDEDEEPEVAARRELREETGYEAADWHLIGRCAPNPSKHTSYAYLFVALGAHRIGSQDLDRSEDIVVRLMDPSEALRLAEKGEITHGIHITTLFWAARKGLI